MHYTSCIKCGNTFFLSVFEGILGILLLYSLSFLKIVYLEFWTKISRKLRIFRNFFTRLKRILCLYIHLLSVNLCEAEIHVYRKSQYNIYLNIIYIDAEKIFLMSFRNQSRDWIWYSIFDFYILNIHIKNVVGLSRKL